MKPNAIANPIKKTLIKVELDVIFIKEVFIDLGKASNTLIPAFSVLLAGCSAFVCEEGNKLDIPLAKAPIGVNPPSDIVIHNTD
jgi:hypothetical protein